MTDHMNPNSGSSGKAPSLAGSPPPAWDDALPAEALKELVFAEQQMLLEELERSQERVAARNRELQANQRSLEQTLQRRLAEQLKAESRLLATRDQLSTMAAEMNQIDERARRHIARQLHDQVVQRLALGKIKLDLAVKRGQLPDSGGIRELAAILQDSMADLRDLSFDLSPPILYELGLNAAIGSLGARLAQEHDFRLAFPGEESEPALREDLKVALFQIARELLINTVKHARPRQVTVEIKQSEDQVRLRVTDDGIGFDARANRTGFGLASIRQRACFMGGGLTILSAADAGTQAEVTLPIKTGSEPGRSSDKGNP